MCATERLSVHPSPSLAVPTTPSDLRDQHWLDDEIDAIEGGIEAVLDIARNWSDLRNLSRLHPGVSAQDYILARVQHPLGRGVVVPLLAESNWSNVQIAAVAGVSEGTVRNVIRTSQSYEVPVVRPAETLGADGKYRRGRVVRSVVVEVVEPADDDPQHQVVNVVAGHQTAPPYLRQVSNPEAVRRATRWYLDAVSWRLGSANPLRAQYGEAIDALRAAFLVDEIHAAEIEVGRRQRALERATAGRRPNMVPGAADYEERQAGEKLAQAEQRLDGLRHQAARP